MKSQRQAQQQSAANQEWMMFIDIHSQEYLLNRNKTKEKKNKSSERERWTQQFVSREKKNSFFFYFFFSFCTSHNWELYICFLAEGVGFTLTISSIVNSEELHIQIQSGERGLSSFGSKLVICKRRWRNGRENRGDKGGTWKEPIRQSGIRPSTQTPKSAGNRLSSSAIFQ